jgi:hypothetical protein
MTMDRDPLLQKLFDIANQDLAGGDVFIAAVMSRIDALRRRAILGWAATGLVLAVAAWLLTPTVVGAVGLLSQALPQSLVAIDEPSALIGRVLSPLNSIAAIVAVTVLVIAFAYRKIF